MIEQHSGDRDLQPVQSHVANLRKLQSATGATMQHQEFTKRVTIELSLLARALELNTVPQQKDESFAEIEAILFGIILGSSTTTAGDRTPKRHCVPVDVDVVRRTLCRTVGALYGKQTHLISTFVNRLLAELTSITAQRGQNWETSATCILYCLGALYTYAATYMPPLTSTMPLLTRLWKQGDSNVRIGILTLLMEYAQSSNHSSLSQDWAEILKFCRNAIADTKSSMVRFTAATCVSMIAKSVSPRVAHSKNFDASLALCVKGMEDQDTNVRSMFGTAAGQLLFGVTTTDSSAIEQSGSASHSSPNTEKKSAFSMLSRKKAKPYTFASALIVLTSPFAKPGASRSVRHAISVAVISYLKQCSLQTIHEHMDVLINHLIGLLSNVKNYMSMNDLQHAMFYIGNIIRMGIAYHVDESGRIAALKELSKAVSNFPHNEYALVCILREIAVLSRLTGEMMITQRDMVLESILSCLRHTSEYVRFVGCMVLRALSESIPSQTMSLVNAMLNMVQMDLAELAISSAESYPLYGNSLHGHANALAAVISVSSRHALSVSHLLCNAALDTAVLLAKKGSSNDDPYVVMRRDEACWILVSAVLSLNNTWLKNSMSKILDLWDDALGSKSPTVLSSDPSILLYQLKSRAMAMLSIAIFLKRCPELLAIEQMKQISKYLMNTVNLISSLPPAFKPTSTAMVHAMTVLKMYLFDAIRRLPSEIISDREYRSVINLVTKMAFAEADGTSTMVETSLLRSILESVGNGYGSISAEDQMKELLDGEDIDTVGYFFDVEHMDESILEADSSCVFHSSDKFFLSRPLSLSTRLVDHAIKLLGRLFVFHRPVSKKRIMDHCVNQLKIILGRPEDVQGSQVVFSNITASVYCILKQLIRSKPEQKEDRSYIANIHAILNSSLGHRNGKVRRAASECMALLGKLVGKSLLDDVIKRCAAKIVGDGPINAGYALALGSVNYALGSLTALTYLPSTVSFLHALSRANSAKIQLSALHSLYRTIESCGAGFSPHIESTLQLITTIVFPPEGKTTCYVRDRHILLGCSRVMAAMIGLGPEVSNNADFAALYRFFIQDFLYSHLESVQLEATLLIERSAMLAPHLLFAMNQLLIPKLRELLVSETTGHQLRQMAAGSVKILAERDPSLVGDLMPIDILFQMLNNVHQFDNRHKAHFEEIILLLLKHGNYEPKRWTDLIHEIVGSQSRHIVARDSNEADSVADSGELMADTDSKADVSRHETESPIFYSWQSKHFALVCLRVLLQLHRNSADASTNAQNPIIPHLSRVIDTATSAASRGTVSSIREGLLVMKSLVELFGSVADPDFPSEVILQQHSAKFSAVITQGFAAASFPLVMTASADLVAGFVSSDIVKGQTIAISRNCAHLTERLPSLKSMHFSQYGEIAAAMVKIAILQALANIYIAAHEKGIEEVLSLLQEHIDSHLLQFWSEVIEDYAVLSVRFSGSEESGTRTTLSSSAEDAISKLPKYFYEEGLESSVIQYFEIAYPSILNALLRAGVRQVVDPSGGGQSQEVVQPNMVLADQIKLGLVLGIAVRSLFDKSNWREQNRLSLSESIAPTFSNQQQSGTSALLFMDTLERLVQTRQFLSLPQAADEIYEIFLLLIKMQDSRHAQYQFACLNLLSAIIRVCDSSFFQRGRHPVEVVLTTIVEVCLKPLKLHFPSMFEQDSERELSRVDLSPEQRNIVVQCMQCLKHVLRRFAIGVHGGNITTILYTICRVLQFTRINTALEVAATLTVLTPDSSDNGQASELNGEEEDSSEEFEQDTPTVWNVAFRAAIEGILVRMENYTITTPGEIDLLFICLFGMQKNTSGLSDRRSLQAVQNRVVKVFDKILRDESVFRDSHRFEVVSWVMSGMQDGVLRLARAGHAPYAIHYLGQLCPSVVTFLTDVGHGRISLPHGDANTETLIMQVVPAGLNILLAAFSLLDESQQKSSFLSVVVLLLVVLLRWTNQNTHISSWNTDRLHKLCVQCLERLATGAGQEFKEQILRLPPEAVSEIQNAAKKKQQQHVTTGQQAVGAAGHTKTKTPKSINFSQYTS